LANALSGSRRDQLINAALAAWFGTRLHRE